MKKSHVHFKISHLFFAGVLFLFPVIALAQPAYSPERQAIEEKVRDVFSDAPVMIDVARCESKFRQFYDNGTTPFRGGTNNVHIGIFQINENLHVNAATAQGFDIYTVDGNVGYAKYLYDKEGSRPWVECVPKDTSPVVPTQPSSPEPTIEPTSGTAPSQSLTPVNTSNMGGSFLITRNLWPGMVHPEVRELQKLLNSFGYEIASSGPGSPGNETMFYGGLTRQAVERFQCENDVVCSRQNGYGYTGPLTRAALLRVSQSS